MIALAQDRDQEVLSDKDDLVSFFREAIVTDASRHLVGPEMEKFGVLSDGKPLAYESGVAKVLDALVHDHGWVAAAEKTGGPRIALTKGQASVTLEPGGQLELSGAAAHDLHAVSREMVSHLEEIAPVSQELGIRWLGLGFHPFAKLEDFSWVPKARYTIMRSYLQTRGSHGLDMMHRTCTVQGNYDFSSEEDAMRKVRLGMKLAPLASAMFANSPWYEGEEFGGVSFRAKVWTDVDPDRTGLVPAIWSENSTFDDYVDWALDVPMFLFKRNGEVIANTGQTFRSFWKNGFQGHVATRADWTLHLNTLFPEVRLKRTIEIRSIDAQGRGTSVAVPALYTGLYYDARALAEAEELTRDWTLDQVTELRGRVWREGLRASFGGQPLAKAAERLLDIAKGGLSRRANKDESGRDESVYLAELERLVAHGKCPADALLEKTRGAADFKAAVIEAAAL